MSGATSLVASLRGMGATLRREGTRVVVEAPSGVITLEIRGQLAESKRELLEVLAKDSPAYAGFDHQAADAVHEISSLLAIAYRRYSAVQRVGSDRRNDSGNGDLANSSESSVHGVVP